MSFPRYPKYKDSGVEWLGKVPAHWEVCALRRVVAAIEQGWSPECYAREADEQEWGVLKAGCVNGGIFQPSENKALPPELSPEEAYEVRAGDVLMSRASGSPELVGSTALVKATRGRLMLSDKIFRFKLKEFVNTPFFVAALNSRSLRIQIENALSGGNGMANNLPQSSLLNFAIAVPPLTEQSTITDFLEQEIAKLDALVTEQKKLIALLQEKRRAVISHAVTKGLDPNVPMEDSGVEWLGEVPGHWAISAVNYRYEVLLGKMLDEKRITGKHLGPYLRNVDVQWDHINIDDLPQMDFEGDDIERYGLLDGDLLVCEGGDVGRAAIWSGGLDECYYQKALHRLRPRQPLRDASRFQYYLLNMAAKLGIFTGGVGKATIAHLTAESLRRYRFAYPPHAEQMKIADFLDEETIKFEALMAEAQSAITLLQERRTALISAAVTGQIDVRSLAPTETA